MITPDLYNDARDATVQNIVESNLKRGVRYVYLTRDDNEEAEAHITEVMHKFRIYDSQLQIIPINDIFGSVPTYNILILEHDENGRLRVFVELPVHEGNERIWWVEADQTLALRWHRRVLELLRGREVLENPYKLESTPFIRT